MRKLALTITIVFCVMLVASCTSDNVDTVEPAPEVQDKDDVLASLEQVWNDRDPDAYAGLLDNGFVGRFGRPERLQGCRSANWDMDKELGAAANIFADRPSVPGVEAVESIGLTLTYPEGEWAEAPQNGTARSSGPVWYSKTVDYRLVAVLGQTGLISRPGSRAEITVRSRKKKDGTTVWKIVAFRDLVEEEGGEATQSAVEGAAWSMLKCMYRPR